MKWNPFYALSAFAMLLACYLLGEALELEAGKLGGLLALIVVLQVYELLLVALGTSLVSGRIAPRDGRVVLVLASVFLMNATGLTTELVSAHRLLGALVTGACGVLALVRLWWVARSVPGLLPRAAAAVLAPHALAVLALPVLANELAAVRLLSPTALYLLWWATAALPIARLRLRDATALQAVASVRAHRAWTWMPCGFVLLHLCWIGYVHTVDFRPAFLSPLLLGASVAARADQKLRQWILPLIAVLCAAGADLHVALPWMGDVPAVRVAVAGLAVAWAYLGWRDRNPWLAGLPIAGAAVYWLGPAAGRAARSFLRLLAEAAPRDRFAWGAMTLVASFVLLAVGAYRSLRTGGRVPTEPVGRGAGVEERHA